MRPVWVHGYHLYPLHWAQPRQNSHAGSFACLLSRFLAKESAQHLARSGPSQKNLRALWATRSECLNFNWQKRKNKVRLTGYLSRNRQRKAARKTGRTFAIPSLATKRAWRVADEEGTQKQNGMASCMDSIGEYTTSKLRKGSHLYVEGTLASRIYENEFGKARNKVKADLSRRGRSKPSSSANSTEPRARRRRKARRPTLSRRRLRSELSLRGLGSSAAPFLVFANCEKMFSS
jgi:single-stranded DNA-binding protein